MHILIAEDNDELRDLLAWSLRRQGCRVTECRDGVHLLKRLAPYILRAEPVDFDLIISDVRMPRVSGLDVLRGIRRLENDQVFPPVILITAFGDEEIHAEAKRLQAAILDKPFHVSELLTKIREVGGVLRTA